MLAIALFLSFIVLIEVYAMEHEQAKHLLLRTSFGVNLNELNSLRNRSYMQAVQTMVNQAKQYKQIKKPVWIQDLEDFNVQAYTFKNLKKGQEKRLALQKLAIKVEHYVQESLSTSSPKKQKNFVQRIIKQHANYKKNPIPIVTKMNNRGKQKLQKLWLDEMLTTSEPLREKMVLFWHNHFTSSAEKVGMLNLMLDQNNIFRRYALGNFRDLLKATLSQPAIHIYLDNDKNTKQSPNENLARELMELFTLGEGHYSEEDIREVARALTGYKPDERGQRMVLKQARHDQGIKTILGQSKNHDLNSVLDLLLSKKETAMFLAQKLHHEFIGHEVNQQSYAYIAQSIQRNNYAMDKVMVDLLTSPFFMLAKKGGMIKSPVELFVGTVRSFNIQMSDEFNYARDLNQLNQSVFYPPNVKGWPGGDSWINTSTLVQRNNLVSRLVRNQQKMSDSMMMQTKAQEVYFDFSSWQNKVPKKEQAWDYLLAIKPYNVEPSQGLNFSYIKELLGDPVYQLK